MPRLVIKKGEGIGRDHALGGGVCSVGRDAAADFTLDDTLVSRRHFNVTQQGGAYWVEDLGSTNGTIVNGRRTERAQLIDGDIILAGGTELTFVQKDLFGATRAPAKRPPVVASDPDTRGAASGGDGGTTTAGPPASPVRRRRRRRR